MGFIIRLCGTISAERIDASDPYIDIHFSEPLADMDDFSGMITLNGAGRYYVQVENARAKVYYEPDGEQPVQLTISDGLKAWDGTPLRTSVTREFSAAEEKPAVEIPVEGSILPNPKELILPFKAVNLKAVDIRVIQVYEENDLLAKTVNSGLYANWNDGEEKEWMRFNGTYGLEYEDGIVIRNHDAYRAGGDPIDFHFELNKENGLLMEAVKMMHYKGDEQATPDRRIVFEYSDIKTDEARYTRMVNAHLIDGDNNYYIFNWY